MITVHLIDASPYLFRAWFSLPKTMLDRSGAPVNAVYGFGTFLARYVADERPSHVAVTFDRNFNGSFRNSFYREYKAHRDPAPPELEAQVDPTVALVEALGMRTFIDDEFEADDLIATIIDQLAGSDTNFIVVTSDKDLTQLVSDRLTVVDPARKLRFDRAAVLEKFGVEPEQIVDFLALTGDAVDNIPGVRGIGAKTAAQLLQTHGTLEAIYEAVPQMRASRKRSEASIAAKLETDVAMAGLSKRLATVATDAPIRVSLADLSYRGPDMASLPPLLEGLGFSQKRWT